MTELMGLAVEKLDALALPQQQRQISDGVSRQTRLQSAVCVVVPVGLATTG
jgi:hypothetical protein